MQNYDGSNNIDGGVRIVHNAMVLKSKDFSCNISYSKHFKVQQQTYL